MAVQRVELRAEARSCGAVRRLVEQLGDALPRTLVRDVSLVADELVLQSLLAGGLDPERDMIVFELDAGRYEVTVAVEDPSDAFRPRRTTDREDRGLGLVIVDEVADRWDVERRGQVTRTWASFRIPSRHPASGGPG